MDEEKAIDKLSEVYDGIENLLDVLDKSIEYGAEGKKMFEDLEEIQSNISLEIHRLDDPYRDL